MKRKHVVIAVVLVVLAGVAYYAWSNRSKGPRYREATIETGEIKVEILSTGTVQPRNRLQIKPPVAGRAESVLVEEGQAVKKGQVLAWMSSQERAALIDSARAQGEAELKRWEELYKPTPVIAPLAGTVIARNIEPGQTFTNADAVLILSDRLTVKAQVDETDLAQIKLKQNCEIRLDAYSERPIPAVVDQIAFEAKTVNNVTTYIIDVLPDKEPDFMRSGMTANVVFHVESKKDVPVVPNEFVKYENGRPTVLVKGDEEKGQRREIETGASDGKKSEILSGLKEGDVVLVENARDAKEKGKNPFSPFGGGGGKGGARGGGRGR